MNEKIEKYLGSYLDDVKKAFIENGLEIKEIIATAPPRERPIELNGNLRVVKIQKNDDSSYSLLVARDMKTSKL